MILFPPSQVEICEMSKEEKRQNMRFYMVWLQGYIHETKP